MIQYCKPHFRSQSISFGNNDVFYSICQTQGKKTLRLSQIEDGLPRWIILDNTGEKAAPAVCFEMMFVEDEKEPVARVPPMLLPTRIDQIVRCIFKREI